uniref:Secretory peptide n=1 Tax=Heteropoda venatoria TaxID=152925 RepID=A0A088BPV7_HETVE|nr:secretory peptide [Heteropoda venatoria]
METFCLLVVISACAVTCSSSGCSQEDETACGEMQSEEWDGTPWPKDEIELNKACSSMSESVLNCYIEFGEQCPNTLTGKFLPVNKAYKNLHDDLCIETKEFRAKFLRNVECLNAESEESYRICKLPSEVEFGPDCNYTDEVKECMRRSLKEKCGPESYDVFSKLLNPIMAFANKICELK